jgi:uncharacterized membrane protein YqgA involved in biofilm formation
LGTIVNAATIVVCAMAGLLIRKGIPLRIQNILQDAVGVSTIMIGVSGVMVGLLRTSGGSVLERQDLMVLILSMVIGAVIGEALKIEEWLNRGANRLQKMLPSAASDNFQKGFVSATILFCVGAMAIVGSIEDGLMRNPTTLYAKSVLDGVVALIFASNLGVGVAFSAIPVLVYQGIITLGAGFLKTAITETMMMQMSLVGSALIFCIGLNLLNIKKIKVGNFIPATFMPIVLELVSTAFGK